ncbi:MAG: PAS domain-containing protein [Casimicrobiaceae bacterium]
MTNIPASPDEFAGLGIDLRKSLDEERLRLQQSAQKQARIFDTTLSAITDFAYTFDRDGRFLYVNKALLTLWGLTLDQAVGRNFFDLQYPELLAARLQQQIQQVIDTGISLRDETPYTSPAGKGGYYEYIFTPVFAEDGSVELVAGSTRDVSARKHTEDLLRARTAQFETLLDRAPLGVYVADARFRLREANPRARLVFGDLPDLIGRDLAQIIHQRWPREFADEVLRHLRHTLETGEPYQNGEHAVRPRDAYMTETYEWQSNRIPLPDGSHGVVCYFREISEQVAARHALEAADRQKNEFLAMLAHELRNPLAPLRNSSVLLKRMLAHDGDAQRALAIITRQADHLTRLVDDLLDVARISNGLIDLKLHPVEVATVVAQALELVAPMMQDKRHTLALRYSGESLRVDGDLVRLVQCVANILANAAKYTDPGGEINVESRREGSLAIIAVTDNGIGITDDLMPRLFKLFVQGHPTLDRTQGGLGVGLALVRKLVEMHGGTVIVARRKPESGTTFEIRLPLAARADASTSASLPITAMTLRRVLIVDDNVDAAESLAAVLRFDGHDVRCVHTADEALAQLGAAAPDVVLLDIGLPQMDGYEVARRMRMLPACSGVRLVALTGYSQPEDRERARAAGFDRFVVKPLDFALLDSILTGHGGEDPR